MLNEENQLRYSVLVQNAEFTGAPRKLKEPFKHSQLQGHSFNGLQYSAPQFERVPVRCAFECQPSGENFLVRLVRETETAFHSREAGEDMDRRKARSGPRSFMPSGSGGGGGGDMMASGDYGSLDGASHWAGLGGSYKDLNKNHLGDLSMSGGKKVEMTPLYQLEDMRISKMLRRLSAENNPSAAIELCEKLQMVVLETSNTAYIRRAFDFLAESLISVLQQGPVESLDQVAKVLGMLGYVIRNEFSIYKNWIFKTYETQKPIRVYLMKALKVTLAYDETTLDLTPVGDRLIVSLKDLLESADLAATFTVVSDVIGQFAKNYKNSFEKHFTDVVDIVVGWHLETEQSSVLKQHCSEVLQNFSDFFVKELDFTLGLLGQFLEDIVTFGEDLLDNAGSRTDLDKTAPPEISVGSFVGAFNSILKCLSNNEEIIAFDIGRNLLTDAIQTITDVGYQSLMVTASQETVQSINEFFILILSCKNCEIPLNIEKVLEIIRLEIGMLRKFDAAQTSSFLFLLITIVRDLQANTPLELICFLLQSKNSSFCRLKLTTNKKHYRGLLKLYQEILVIKNVPILQEAYKHIISDMKNASRAIIQKDRSVYTLQQAECILNFYLVAISILATQTSSIIGMYALQPSILELLIVELKAANVNLWHESTTAHGSIVNLLAVHCIKNNNYITSSNLLMSNVFSKLSLDDTSPTSENFSLILKFLSEILRLKTMEVKTAVQLLDWAYFIIQQCVQHDQTLENCKHFVEIGINICSLSVNSPDNINLKCAHCIEKLLEYKKIHSNILTAVGEICCIHMCSNSKIIRDLYSNIFAKLPLAISLKQVGEPTGLARMRNCRVRDLQHWYVSSAISGDLREKYFKNFIEKLSVKHASEFVLYFLRKIFDKCWTSQRGKAEDFCTYALNDVSCLVSWAQWEAAQYCVTNKLRTSLGKPQDTFLKIEAIVKESARILALKDSATIKSVDDLIGNYQNARVLLGFLECLEKAIFNAAEGNAFAMPAPEKPARTFFRVNAPTCNEWFNRIRGAVEVVALHCMEPEMIIRYSEAVLRNLVASGRSSEPVFETALLSYTRALLKTGESDAIQGVYVWAKSLTGKRFIWIKMAAEQTAGHREKALEGYSAILDGKDEKTDQIIYDFVADQMAECLIFTNQSHRFEKFVVTLPYEPTSHGTATFLDFTWNKTNYYSDSFASGDTSTLSLSSWGESEKFRDVPNNFSFKKLLALTENTLEHFLTSSEEDLNEESLRICKNVIHAGLQESLRTKSKEHLNNLIVLNHVTHKLYQRKIEGEATDLQSFTADKNYGSLTLARILKWAEHFHLSSTNPETRNYDLRLRVASLARKEGNYKFCRSELEKFFARSQINSLLCLDPDQDCGLEEICSEITKTSGSQKDFWKNDVINGVYEASKLLFSQPDKHNDAMQLAASCSLGIIAKISNQTIENDGLSEKVSQVLLTLSDWLGQSNESLVISDDSTPIRQLLLQLPEIKDYPDEKINSVIPSLEIAVGKLIQSSVKQCPKLAKSWGAMGNWCYRWGRKIVETRTETDKAGLQGTDISAIKDLVPNATEADVQKIVAILNQHQVSVDDEEVGPNEISSTEMIDRQLRNIDILARVDVEVISSIVGIWRQAHKSVYGYYEMAADSYFKYLNLASSDEKSPDENVNGDCSIVTATLRLLRLVVKHALGLQEVLDEGLATTPTCPWKVIIPQLFSRLNHHESYVRRRVSELLCRVAKDSPHLIIFPAVVGAAQEQNNDDEDDENTSSNNALAMCFNSLSDTLSKQACETVEQVQLLVKELKRVTLLWDEFWLHSLAQLYSEYSELFNSLEAEAHKTEDDRVDTLAQKHRILMSHVIQDIQKLQKVTSRPAETNYERNFQEKYSKIIQDTIDELGKPLNREKPNESWQKIKQLYAIFQQRLQKSSQTTLKMADISPALANMRSTAISMPGVESVNNHQIYIESVDNIVYILPTKTKPKKLAFFGSNGKRYTYLFKGLEDLHLDERIMQFLSIANSMMSKSSDCNGNVTSYHAHHYSVIPLGPRSGLISWVDGVTPIFALYKKWQQREAANPKKEKQFMAMRPSEMFYNKLTPLLAEHNIKVTDSRKTWPVAVLRKVLEELSKETPRDLLAKELWCHSSNSAAWRKAVRMYSLSVAVMSVIGYVIGLGDRHLDNVLVKLTTGEIVHIDYNVCFEKGKTLRVPEKVPFRMTPNLEEALGITGIEGTFRLACEHVLKILRKERETLLTLLEAFVYDPLVDWAVNDDGTTTSTRTTTALTAASDIAAIGAAVASTSGSASMGPAGDGALATNTSETSSERKPNRKKLENEVMRDTLTSRFAEIKPEWTQYRNDVNDQLRQMTNCLDKLEAQRIEMRHDESQRDLLTKQLAMVQEVESLGTAMTSHSLNTLSQRFLIFRKSRDEFDHVNEILAQKLTEYATNNDLYFQTLSEITEAALTRSQIVLQELNYSPLNNEFELVKELLENSAQGALYLQADQARKELDASFIQQSAIIQMALETLRQYENIVKYVSQDLMRKHRFERYKNWCSKLLEKPDLCHEVLEEFKGMLNEEGTYDILSENSIPYARDLEQQCIEANMLLKNNFDLLQMENSDESIKLYDEAQNAIAIFLRVENGSLKSLQCAALVFLCEINRQYITFEECRINRIDNEILLLNSSSTFLSLIKEFTQIIIMDGISPNPDLMTYLNALDDFRAVVASLKEFELQFQSKIIPRIIQAFMSNCKSPLLEVIQLGSRPEYDLDFMAEKFSNIRKSVENCELEDIFMLIEENFNVVLGNIEKCMRNLTASSIDERYDGLDHMQETNEMALYKLNEHYIKHTLNSLRLKKFQVIVKTFEFAESMTVSLCTNNLHNIFNSKILQTPIMDFINECELKCVLGLGPFIGSFITGELLKEMNADLYSGKCTQMETLALGVVENNLTMGSVSLAVYNIAKTMCTNLNLSVRKREHVENLEHFLPAQTEYVNFIRAVSSAHAWMNEQTLSTQPPKGLIIHKSLLLINFQNAIQNLNAWQISIKKINDEVLGFTSAIVQRLKWASGANPALCTVQTSFDQLVALHEQKFQQHFQLANQCLRNCTAISCYENFKINLQDIADHDEKFLYLLSQLDKANTAFKSATSVISPVEQALVQLLDPEGSVDHVWIGNVSGLLDDMTDSVQQKIAALEKDTAVTQDNLQMCAHKLRSLMGSELRMEVRYLLKLILKIDGSGQAVRNRQFQSSYKQFLGRISDLHVKVLSKDFTEDIVKEIRELIDGLLIELDEIYNDLLKLVVDRHSDNDKKDRDAKAGSSGTPVKESRKGNQPEQKRNAYAVSVWRRIRMKLEGRDPDPNRRLTAAEQVDWMIREAMNPDNLAVLYEGWTPWV